MLAGVIDSVLRRELDADVEVFARAARAGFAGVEVALGRDDLRANARARLASLRGAAATTGLPVTSLVLSDHVPDGGLADADDSTRRRAVEDVRTAVALAGELGADVVLVPFFLRGAIEGEAALDRCALAFAQVCPDAEAAGVTLGYEGTLPAGVVRELADRVGSPAFGCYFDLANPLVDGLDPPTELRALGSLVCRVHFKDARDRRGDVAPGLGRVDFAACAQALDELGYDGWLVLETPPASTEETARHLSFARRFFPQLEPRR